MSAISMIPPILLTLFRPPPPPVQTDHSHSLNVDAAYVTIRNLITRSANIPLALDLVEGYLYAAAGRLQVYVSKPWMSYKLVILAGTGNVTTQELLEARHKQGNPPPLDNPTGAVSDAAHRTVSMVLLSIYRLGQIDKMKVSQYYTTLDTKIQDILRVSPFDDDGMVYLLGSLVQNYSPWAGSPVFAKLVAAYDMVLAKAPAPWTLMRIATVTSAYEGCNGLLSIGHFSKKLGLQPEEALGYVMFREAARNLTTMLHPHQEVETGDSYFSHFRAFGFSPKSPYSATAVPYFYNLVHLVGAYMGDVDPITPWLCRMHQSTSLPSWRATSGTISPDLGNTVSLSGWTLRQTRQELL